MGGDPPQDLLDCLVKDCPSAVLKQAAKFICCLATLNAPNIPPPDPSMTKCLFEDCTCILMANSPSACDTEFKQCCADAEGKM